MQKHFLDFEKPIAELEGKIEELRHMSNENGHKGINIVDEVSRLQSKLENSIESIYSKLTPWQRVKVARHPDRPKCTKYVESLFTDFTPLAGDRLYSEDNAMVSGMGRFKGQAVVVLGNERGSDTQSRLKHNFGMARPEGYRKAQRLMDLADRFNLPIITFVDTPGAYPGIGAEERGQSEAIAKSIEKSVRVGVPIISTVTGEGGSGGAIAIATANVVMMLENSVYSVISPEGCASILWRSAAKAKDASEALKITAADLLRLKIIDKVIKEPLGGAHRDPKMMVGSVANEIDKQLSKFAGMSPEAIKSHRREKFLTMTRL